MLCVPIAPYATVQTAPPLLSGWLRQDAIGCPPSRNSTEPVGWTVPARCVGSITVAVYVVIEPTPVVWEASSEVAVASGLTRTVVELDELPRPDPASAVKAAVS